ncbi:hypothetical protein [Oryzifoliimicrobium ureilyticus]|uniref:hypothetical protein n=1 Tax=Oryzifoliimicrobium ureilyticus TaxID=3113724 RepID=UPI00307614FA
MSRDILLVIAVSILATSCSDGSQKQQKALNTILSWTASAEMIAEARAGRIVPETYSALALERCQEEVSALLAELDDNARNDVKDIPVLIHQASEAATKEDRVGVSQRLEALRQRRAEIKNRMPRA